MPGQENTRTYGLGQRVGSLGKLKEIYRKCEGICDKLIKTPGAGWDAGWVYGVGALGKRSKKT